MSTTTSSVAKRSARLLSSASQAGCGRPRQATLYVPPPSNHRAGSLIHLAPHTNHIPARTTYAAIFHLPLCTRRVFPWMMRRPWHTPPLPPALGGGAEADRERVQQFRRGAGARYPARRPEILHALRERAQHPGEEGGASSSCHTPIHLFAKPSAVFLSPMPSAYLSHMADSRPSPIQADGCVLVKTKQAILVAEYRAPLQAAECTPVVEGLADYLISVGY